MQVVIIVLCILVPLVTSVIVYKSFPLKRHYIPGFFTSFGVLGTFASLLVNIWFVKNLTEIDTVFIHNFASAFITSLIGIIGSFIAKLAISIPQDSEDEKQVEQYSELYYLKQVDTRLQALEKEQKALHENFVKHKEALHAIFLHESEGKPINMQNHVISELQNLLEVSRNIEKSFRQSAESLGTKLAELLAPEINEMSKQTLSELKGLLENTKKEQERTSQSYDETLKTTLGELVQTTKSLNERLAQEVATQREESQTALKSLSTEQAQKLAEMSEKQGQALQKMFESLSQRLQSEMNGVSQSIQSEMQSEAQAIVDAQKNIVALAEKESSERTKALQKRNEEEAQALQDTTQQLSAKLAEHVQNQETSMKAQLQEQSQQWKNYQEHVQGQMQDIREQLSEEARVLRTNMGGLKGIIDKMETWQKNSQTFLDTSVRQLHEAGTKLEASLQGHDKRNAAFDASTKHIEALSESMSTLAQKQKHLLEVQAQTHERMMHIETALATLDKLRLTLEKTLD